MPTEDYDCRYPDEAIAGRSVREAGKAADESVLINAARRRSVLEYQDFL
jgi:hypothetical protein